jgi:lysophospholipase L1-like esterase
LNAFQTPLVDAPLLVTIFFGANDAVMPDHIHNEKHVPLKEYKENLLKIISHIRVSS